MLNYIVPPIIIVISLAILIAFLFRKFSNGENIDPRVIESLNGNGPKSDFWRKSLSFFSNLWLKLLEKIMQKTKLFSLKMHNASNNWFHSIKSKRERSDKVVEELKVAEKEIVFEREEKSYGEEMDVPGKMTEAIDENKKFFRFRKPTTDGISEKADKFYRKKGSFFSKQKEAEEVVEKITKKENLEDELIKRIAINPKDIEAYERLGDYYSEMNNFRDSIECYKQVLKLSPDNSSTRIKMKNLELLLKK